MFHYSFITQDIQETMEGKTNETNIYESTKIDAEKIDGLDKLISTDILKSEANGRIQTDNLDRNIAGPSVRQTKNASYTEVVEDKETEESHAIQSQEDRVCEVNCNFEDKKTTDTKSEKYLTLKNNLHLDLNIGSYNKLGSVASENKKAAKTNDVEAVSTTKSDSSVSIDFFDLFTNLEDTSSEFLVAKTISADQRLIATDLKEGCSVALRRKANERCTDTDIPMFQGSDHDRFEKTYSPNKNANPKPMSLQKNKKLRNCNSNPINDFKPIDLSDKKERRSIGTNNDKTADYKKTKDEGSMKNTETMLEPAPNETTTNEHTISFTTEHNTESLKIHIGGDKQTQRPKSLLDYTVIGPALLKNTMSKGGYNVNKIDLSMNEKVCVTLFQRKFATMEVEEKPKPIIKKEEPRKLTTAEMHAFYMKNHLSRDDSAKYKSTVDVRYSRYKEEKPSKGGIRSFFTRLFGKTKQ